NVPCTESYFSRWASVSASVMSLTATKSRSEPDAKHARRMFRPMRPKPLIPTRTPIIPLDFVGVADRSCRRAWLRYSTSGLDRQGATARERRVLQALALTGWNRCTTEAHESDERAAAESGEHR